MATWKDTLARLRTSKANTLARLRASKAEADARAAEEQAERDRLEAEQAERVAEQAAKEEERGRIAAENWIETADYESLWWAVEALKHSPERRALLRGRLARDFDEIFAIDLTDGLDSDPATEAFFRTISEVVRKIDGKD